MKFLVTADNNGAIGRGEQPLVTIPAVQQGFLKETQKSSGHGAENIRRASRGTAIRKTHQCGAF